MNGTLFVTGVGWYSQRFGKPVDVIYFASLNAGVKGG
jgi:hypothetical protein